MNTTISNVDEYIANFPNEIQQRLLEIRAIIKQQAPEATEGIAYGMPAYKLHKKPLAYFAAYPKHIGVYATPNAHSQFSKELATYKQGKGSVQFPLNQELPLELIKKMVIFRKQEILAKN